MNSSDIKRTIEHKINKLKSTVKAKKEKFDEGFGGENSSKIVIPLVVIFVIVVAVSVVLFVIYKKKHLTLTELKEILVNRFKHYKSQVKLEVPNSNNKELLNNINDAKENIGTKILDKLKQVKELHAKSKILDGMQAVNK